LDHAAGADRQRLRATLFDSSRALGLALSDRQADQLLEFLALLSRWNRTYNLTAIRDLPGMLTHHVVDCLAIVEPLRRQRAAASAGTLLDVGSGGGLPGLIIAVMDPAVTVTCVDAVGKKAAFVRQAAASLEIGNLRVEHARVQALSESRFDVAVSRAYASLEDFARSTRRLLADDGVWVAMKGKRPDSEISAVQGLVDMFHVEPLAVPNEVGERCLVWMRPVRQASSSAQHQS
jgi:16S rRNA (guanine527-N7)-methyltransferase